MNIEELSKTIADMQTIINQQNDTITQMKENYDTNNTTISELMKLNNELMLNVAGSQKEEQEEEIKLESKLLGEYADYLDKDELSEFINTFEKGE